jgi:hypothetical protein
VLSIIEVEDSDGDICTVTVSSALAASVGKNIIQIETNNPTKPNLINKDLICISYQSLWRDD